MKRNPYKEIINLKKEVKEYKKLCRNNSKKFKHYSDWENHIRTILEGFTDKDNLYDFKRFCMYCERKNAPVSSIFMGIMILYTPFAINAYAQRLNNQGLLFCIFIISIIVIGLFGLIYFKTIRYNNEVYFYKDIVEIIEKMEKQ